MSALAIRLTFASTGGAERGEALAAHAYLFAERAQSPSAALRVKQALCRAWRSHAPQLSAALLKQGGQGRQRARVLAEGFFAVLFFLAEATFAFATAGFPSPRGAFAFAAASIAFRASVFSPFRSASAAAIHSGA